MVLKNTCILSLVNSGLMAHMKRAFTGEVRDLADPYIEVSFAGHKVKLNWINHKNYF